MRMVIPMEFALTAFLLLLIALANGWATRLVLRDELISMRQRTVQVLLIWLIPVIGAILVFAVYRRPEPPSLKYRDAPDPGDDYAYSGRSARSSHQVDADE